MHLQERTVPRATLSNGFSGDTSRCVGLDGKFERRTLHRHWFALPLYNAEEKNF